MPTIELQNVNYKYLTKEFEVLALDNFNAVFENGKINVIIGESGCGKTTLLKAILGVINYEGDIYFDNDNVNMLTPKKRDCSYVNQDIALYPHLSIFNNIAFPLQLLGLNGDEIRRRVNEIATKFNLMPCLSRLPREISIGQAQRACIAKAMVKKSSIYIFDEPFSNLDPAISSQIQDEIKNILCELNATTIFVTHNINDALKLADFIYVVKDGQLVEKGKMNEIMSSNNEYTKGLVGLV